MPLSGFTVSLSTSAAQVSTIQGHVNKPNKVLVRNDSGINVYLGNADVDSTSFLLADGESVEVDVINEHLYAVAASGTPDITVLEH